VDWNFVGNAHGVRAVQGSLRAGRAAQTYLIAGPPGVGRRTFAIRLAQEIWCAGLPEPVETSEPYRFLDDANAMWRTAVRRGHPDEEPDPDKLTAADGRRVDLRFVLTVYKDLHVLRRADGARDIVIDGVREWGAGLYRTPATRPMRIGLIDSAHEINALAANALLKTLEEPGAHAILILTAPRAADVLPTIVSRCRVIELGPVPLAEIVQHLSANFSLPADTVGQIARAARGRPGWAIRMALDPAAWDARRTAGEEASAFEAAPVSTRFRAVNDVLPRGRMVAQTREALAWLRTLEVEQSHTLRSAMRDHPVGAPSERRAALASAVGRLTRLRATQRALIANVSPRLALEDLALRPELDPDDAQGGGRGRR
jgi:DNA polymerase-3 subunit delta'